MPITLNDISSLANIDNTVAEAIDENFLDISDDLEDKGNSISDLISEVMEFGNVVDFLTTAIANTATLSITDGLQAEIANIEASLVNVLPYVGNLSNDIASLEAVDADIIGNIVPAIASSISNVASDITDTNANVANLVVSITNIEGDIVTINNNITVIEGSVSNVESDIVDLTDEVDALKYQVLTVLDNIPLYRVRDVVNNMHKKIEILGDPIGQSLLYDIHHAYIQAHEALRLAFINTGKDMPLWDTVLKWLFDDPEGTGLIGPAEHDFDYRVKQVYQLLVLNTTETETQKEMRKAYVAYFNCMARLLHEIEVANAGGGYNVYTSALLNYALLIDDLDNGFVDTVIEGMFNNYDAQLNNRSACYATIYKILKNNPYTPLTAESHVTTPWAPL